MGVSEKRRSTFVRLDGTVVRRCNKCGQVKDLELDFYVSKRDELGNVTHRSNQCKPCQIKRTGEYAKAQRRNPETAARVRAKGAAQRRDWRRRHPGANAEAVRRYKQKVKADPQRAAAKREAARLTRRLRQEREGKPIGAPHPVARHLMRFTKGRIYDANPDKRVPHPDGGDCVEVWRAAHMHRPPPSPVTRMPRDNQNRLPAAPLAEAVMARTESAMYHDGLVPLDEFCQTLGVPARTLLRWRNEKGALVQFDIADRVLTRLDLLWFDVWSPEEFPEVAERLAA